MSPDPLPPTEISRDAVPADADVLMQRIAQGDHSAFAALFDQFAPAVFGLALRVVRERSRAEEVAQEALFEIWRNASRFDPTRGSAKAYVLTIAHRRAVDVVRREQAGRNREHRLALVTETPYDAVEEAVTAGVDAQEVRRCLRSLTPLQHEAVTLAFYGGHTYPEVATLLAVNPSTVKTRLRDGLSRLRDCLAMST